MLQFVFRELKFLKQFKLILETVNQLVFASDFFFVFRHYINTLNINRRRYVKQGSFFI